MGDAVVKPCFSHRVVPALGATTTTDPTIQSGLSLSSKVSRIPFETAYQE